MRAELLGIVDPPAVEPVRVVTPEEHYLFKHQCLVEQGFDVELVDGGLDVHFAPGQGEAYDVADYVCFAKYPVHRMHREPLTEVQLRAVYGYVTGGLTTCLQEAGLAVAEPPTWESFKAAHEAGHGLWAPIGPIHGDSPDTMLTASESCQLNTPTELLYPESG